jgi:hypothetical protein
MPLAEARLTHLESDIVEAKGNIGECLDRLEDHSEQLHSLQQWRKGNGAKGAEQRLQAVEGAIYDYHVNRIPQRLNVVEADIEALQKIADARIGEAVTASVKHHLDERDHEREERENKFWAKVSKASKILVPIITLLTVLLMAVFHVQI